MSTAPQVLVVTSVGSSSAAVTPVLAALEATDMRVRAIDVGRLGSDSEGTVERVLRAVVGELSERRLSKELSANPPDVVVAFDPGTTQTLTVARDGAQKPCAVVAVIDALAPPKGWAATDADRYLVVDEESAVALAEYGVESERILPIGPLCAFAYAAAGTESRAGLRRRFKIGSSAVVVVEVAGLGYEMTSQTALQLSLSEADAIYLFDAGDDSEAATALRQSVPKLGMKAKLFGATADSPLYWRCADVVIARPTALAVARTMAVGARLVSFAPDDQDDSARAQAVEDRKLGARAPNALLLSSALEPLLGLSARKDSLTGADGAANAADVVWIVGEERNAVIDERHSARLAETRARVKQATSAAAQAAKVSAPAGGLEDLSGGAVNGSSADAAVPDVGEIVRLRAELETRRKHVSKSVFAARETADKWGKRILTATTAGDQDLARHASKNADLERTRMHEALAEMAQIESEIKALDRAETQARIAAASRASRGASSSGASGASARRRRSEPSVDDLLDKLKREANTGGGTSTRTSTSTSTSTSSKNSGEKKKRRRKRKKSSVDAELAALKRKMANKGKD